MLAVRAGSARAAPAAAAATRTANRWRILENFLPEDLIGIGEADLEARGLYQLMRAKGVNIRVAKQRIGARPAPPRSARCSASARAAPC